MNTDLGFRRQMKRVAKRAISALSFEGGFGKSFSQRLPRSSQYWTDHNVTLHKKFVSAADSLRYFHWRNDQYFNYIELMPVSGQDHQVVLDFGCGPGNDLVGFSLFSKPKSLIGADVSPVSIEEARHRLQLHQADCQFLLLDERTAQLNLEASSIDYIHCSGVLHHTSDPLAVLREFRRVLKPTGCARIMVYHYDSLWMHLYVAYMKCILEAKEFSGLSLREAFQRTTDGPSCPISRVYKQTEFIKLCAQAGFDAGFLGTGISMHEMSILPKRFAAIERLELPEESRRFLLNLEIDSHGYAKYNGYFAGINGCYLLRPEATR